MSIQRQGPKDLDDRDKTFLAQLGLAIRNGSLGFARGGQFIDSRFSLGTSGSNGRGHPRRADALRSPQERLVGALRWAIEPTSGAHDEERQAICLLAWLVSDETAHLLNTILCDFQMLPWKSAACDGRDPSHAARSLWGSREGAAVEAFDLRLVHAARRAARGLGVRPLGS